MSKAHRERLEKAGWKVGDAAEFLDLTDVEAALVEAKLALGDAVRALRQRVAAAEQFPAAESGTSGLAVIRGPLSPSMRSRACDGRSGRGAFTPSPPPPGARVRARMAPPEEE
jgi:hypothetical protein